MSESEILFRLNVIIALLIAVLVLLVGISLSTIGPLVVAFAVAFGAVWAISQLFY